MFVGRSLCLISEAKIRQKSLSHPADVSEGTLEKPPQPAVVILISSYYTVRETEILKDLSRCQD